MINCERNWIICKVAECGIQFSQRTAVLWHFPKDLVTDVAEFASD